MLAMHFKTDGTERREDDSEDDLADISETHTLALGLFGHWKSWGYAGRTGDIRSCERHFVKMLFERSSFEIADIQLKMRIWRSWQLTEGGWAG
jgi:hypothetical protein